MDNGYLSLFGAFPDLISLTRRKDQLWLLTILIAIILAITVAYAAIDMYLLWRAWPMLFNPSRLTVMAAFGYCILVASNLLMLYVANIIFSNIVKSHLGTSKQPHPQLSRAIALLGMIRAHDSSLAPVADDTNSVEQEVFHADSRDSVNEEVVIADASHPMASADTLGLVWHYASMGVGAIALICASITIAPKSYQDLLALETPSVIIAVHEPMLSWISHYRFVFFFGFYELVAVLVGVYLGISTLLSWRHNHIARVGFTAQINAQRIQARFPDARDMARTARWGDVNGFARQRYRDVWAHDHEVYLLAVGESVLLWEKPPLIPYTGPKVTARLVAARAAADKLVEQVKLHTPTALVDITEVAAVPALILALNGYYPEPETVRAILGVPPLIRWYQRFSWIFGLLLYGMAAGVMVADLVIVQPFK
jgi:hypothetical protein